MLRVTLHEEGTYICEAKNELNTAKMEVSVTVLPVLKLVTTPPSNYSGHHGSRIQLDSQGNEHSNVTWQPKESDLPTDHLIHSNGTLILLNISDSSSGNYVCTVNNVFRLINTATHLRVLYRSCSHLKVNFPSKLSGSYDVDPSCEDPFTVYCDMTDKNGVGVTVISHDSEQRGYVSGCDAPGCFAREVTYSKITTAQLVVLSNVSAQCEQFIMFECNHDVAFIEQSKDWWVSSEGIAMYYWGGASPGSRRCACGVTNTCIFGGGCNCKNGGTPSWRNDSGLLTDKLSLPAAELRFGDVGRGNEEGYYTLGKFKCYGDVAITGNVLSMLCLS